MGSKIDRITWIDGLKGWAILLVILGHVIQTLCPDFDDNHVFRYIYSFHMPLFMFLSGYFATLYPNIRKRALQLLLPFGVWAFVSAVLHSNLNGTFIINLLREPDNGLWFLYSLFFIIVSFSLCANLSNKLKRIPFIVILGGNIILLYLLAYLCGGSFGTGTLFLYFAFYSLGYLFHQNENQYISSLVGTKKQYSFFEMLCISWFQKFFVA